MILVLRLLFLLFLDFFYKTLLPYVWGVSVRISFRSFWTTIYHVPIEFDSLYIYIYIYIFYLKKKRVFISLINYIDFFFLIWRAKIVRRESNVAQLYWNRAIFFLAQSKSNSNCSPNPLWRFRFGTPTSQPDLSNRSWRSRYPLPTS